jgi:hypothetical protein
MTFFCRLVVRNEPQQSLCFNKFQLGFVPQPNLQMSFTTLSKMVVSM